MKCRFQNATGVGLNVGIGLLHRYTGLQPRKYAHPPGTPIIQRAVLLQNGFSGYGDRDLKLCADLNTGEPDRRNADDFKRMSVNRQVAANRGSLASVFSLPERVAQYGDGCCSTTPVVLPAYQTAGSRRNAESLKQIAASVQSLYAPDFANRRQVKFSA